MAFTAYPDNQPTEQFSEEAMDIEKSIRCKLLSKIDRVLSDGGYGDITITLKDGHVYMIGAYSGEKINRSINTV